MDNSIDVAEIGAQFGLHNLAAPHNPIFISGVPRSGTTILSALLDRAVNGSVKDPAESFALNYIHDLDNSYFGNCARACLGTKSPQVNAFNYLIDRLEKGEISRVDACRWYFILAANFKKPTQLVEKTPSNVLFIPTICSAFSNARLLFCTRHPLHVYVSFRERLKRELARGNARDAGWLDKKPGEFAQFYNHYCDKCFDLIESGFALLIVKYEELSVSDKRPLRRILSHVSCPDVEGVIDRYNADLTAMFESRQYNVEEMLGLNERNLINSMTAKNMRRLGYE
jgi:hypothetical protein